MNFHTKPVFLRKGANSIRNRHKFIVRGGGGRESAYPLKRKGTQCTWQKSLAFWSLQKPPHTAVSSAKQSSVLLFSAAHRPYWPLRRGHFWLLHLRADLGQPHVWGVQPLPANVHMQKWQISDWRRHYWQFYSRKARPKPDQSRPWSFMAFTPAHPSICCHLSQLQQHTKI